MSDKENVYVKAIHHPDELEAILALQTFASDEIAAEWERLNELQNADGEDVLEDPETWSYHKGRLDTFRLIHGMAVQREIRLRERQAADEDTEE